MAISKSEERPLARAHGQFGGGRLGVYVALGAAARVVPLPWIPETIARRVRGALVFDVAARHGVSLSPEARQILADPSGGEDAGARGIVRQAARYVGVKLLHRFTPIGALPPVRSGLSVFVLGYLFDRYLDRARVERSVRIDEAEARSLRSAIDRALLQAVTTSPEDEQIAGAPEELRDEITQVTDTLLMAAASVPGFVVRRLDAAFDAIYPPARG